MINIDARSNLINDIKYKLAESLNDEQMSKLDNVLHLQLDKYEIQDRCTNLTLTNDSPLNYLQKFVIAKNIEGLSQKTIERYYREIYNMLYSLGKSVDEITSFDIRTYLIRYRQTHDISNRTLDNMRRCYSSFFSWLYKEEIINRNPCISVPQIKYDKTIKLPFSSVEMEKIKRSCTSKRDRAIIEILYATGCRVSELSSLNRTDIDYIKQTAIVHGKGGKDRVVYITDVAMLYLTEYLEQRADTDMALFIGRRGRLSKGGIESILKKLGQAAGVEDVHPHRYRRTLATNLLDRGADIQEVAEVLGHEDISTTKIYCYITQQNISNTYNKYIF